MTPQTLLELLFALSDPTTRLDLIREHLYLFDEQGAEWFKTQAVQRRLSDTQQALQIAGFLVEAATLRHEPSCRAYGLWANAVIHTGGLGAYEQALTYYDEAIAIFTQANQPLNVAKMQISRVWPLAMMNRITEAFAAGEEATATLQSAQEWYLLTILQMNLASIYSRIGDDAKAAAMHERVQHAYEALAPMNHEHESHWAIAVHNQAISLFYLGNFTEAIEAAQRALITHQRLGNHLEAARVTQLLGMVNFVMGRYNKGLRLLNEVRSIFWADGSLRNTARVDLYLCDCLLHLGRFREVLDKILPLRDLFRQLQSPHEEGLAVLYGASAYVGHQQIELALSALAEARLLFVQAQNQTWVATCDLAQAHLLFQQMRYLECLMLAQQCTMTFSKHQLATAEAEAHLLITQALLALDQQEEAFTLLQDATLYAAIQKVPALTVSREQALGRLARQKGEFDRAYDAYSNAIIALEYLRGQMMVEHRITFQSDKQVIYEEMISLCLQMNQVETAFGYVERVKSRALLDLIDNRIDLRIQVRNEADRPLVEQLQRLRSERDRLYRQSYDMEQGNERGWITKPQDEEKQQEILRLEKEIGERWHQLLIRNADYAQDVPLPSLAAHDIHLNLPTDTIVLEFFTIQECLLLFLVTRQGITVVELPSRLGSIKKQIERLRRHMQSVQHFPSNHLTILEKQAQFLLHELYKGLLAPVTEQIIRYAKLVIVPHDVLHYLPFHALYDGCVYLIERYEISYLPNASLWQRLQQPGIQGEGALAVGCSADGRLPHTGQEAQRMAQLFHGDLLLEEAATREQISTVISNKALLHFATHAIFDANQPLFSGLLLADGWLTAFDVFNLQLKADLVTLSACQTGRSVLGGGDELLGLLRAFLYAGARSVIVSLWSVADEPTAELMAAFYTTLQQSTSKSAALRQAQLAFCHAKRTLSTPAQPEYTHPYFWASFFLIGNTDRFSL